MNLRSILLVEDDIGIQAVARFSLEMDGHWQVEVANCGEEGLSKAETINPSVILLDTALSDMETIEVLKQFVLDRKVCNIPIILFTTKLIDLKPTKNLCSSVVGVIYKPFDSLTLSNEISNLLNSRLQSATNHGRTAVRPYN